MLTSLLKIQMEKMKERSKDDRRYWICQNQNCLPSNLNSWTVYSGSAHFCPAYQSHKVSSGEIYHYHFTSLATGPMIFLSWI